MTLKTQPQPKAATAEKPLLMTRMEVTFTLRIGLGKLNDMLRKGELPKVKIGRRCLIPTKAVEAFAAQAGGGTI